MLCLVTWFCLTLWPHGLWPARLLCPWDSPGKSTALGCQNLPQGIFRTQALTSCLLFCRHVLYHLSQHGSPRILELVAYLFSRGTSWLRNQTRVSCISGRFFTSWGPREAPTVIYKLRITLPAFLCENVHFRHNWELTVHTGLYSDFLLRTICYIHVYVSLLFYSIIFYAL